jgi:2-(1,2-epoxy-1,2-dihydrophenyl)acetyl-CoA isomerase
MSGVSIDDRGPIRIIRLNRPEQRNALDWDALLTLRAAVAEARTMGFRAVILTGEGKCFCTGADLAEYDAEGDQAPTDDGSPGGPRVPRPHEEVWQETAQAIIYDIYTSPAPFIAAINGSVAGGGFDFALACDFRIAARSAKFHPAMRNLGLCPDLGASWLLTRTVGAERAKKYYLLDQHWTAEDALTFGALSEVCADDALMDRAMVYAEGLARLPAMTIARTKRLIAAAEELSLVQSLASEIDAAQLLARTPDAAEAVDALMKRRDPRFKHTW